VALSLEQKQAIVSEVASVAAQASNVIAAEYAGLTVTELTRLRGSARKSGVFVKVVRNTLARRAFEGTKFACMNEKLVGPLLLAFAGEEPGSAAKVIRDFAKQNDKLVLGSGFTKGWDNFDNSGNPNMGYLGTATYTRDNGDTLAYVCTLGREPNFSGSGYSPSIGSGYSTRYLQTLVYSHKFSDDVVGVAQSDFGTQEAATWDGRTAHWYGANGYLYWNQTCRLQWGANAEWFRDQSGFRVGQVLPSFGSPNARGLGVSNGQTRFGYDGSFYRLMFGPKYFFTPNLYTRVAVAADWYEGKRNSLGNLPFDDGQRNHQELAVFDLVWTF